MVFEWAVIPLIISNVFFKSSGKYTDTFVYVEIGRSMSEKSTCNLRKNNVLVTTWNRRNKLDIRIVVLVTLNRKNENFKMLLVS